MYFAKVIYLCRSSVGGVYSYTFVLSRPEWRKKETEFRKARSVDGRQNGLGRKFPHFQVAHAKLLYPREFRACKQGNFASKFLEGFETFGILVNYKITDLPFLLKTPALLHIFGILNNHLLIKNTWIFLRSFFFPNHFLNSNQVESET